MMDPAWMDTDSDKEIAFLKREMERMELLSRIEIAATIECCAQVADDEADKQYDEGKAKLLRKAAAAIRALKDKP